MTKDWRKELGLEYVDYKWQMDNRFKVPDEVYFVHEFLDYLKTIKSFRVKRKLRGVEIADLSQKDKFIYEKLDDVYEDSLQTYLRDHDSINVNEVKRNFSLLLKCMIKHLNSKKIVTINADKFAKKYSEIPFLGKIDDEIEKYSNWADDIRFNGYEGKKMNIETEKRKPKVEIQEQSDLVSKIDKLKKLYKRGALDKQEFEKAKNKLLK